MNKIYLDKQEIKRLYLVEKMTGKEIAKIYGISVSPIFKIIKEFGIVRGNQVIRDSKEYILSRIKVDENGCWNYPYSLQTNGYARIQGEYAHRASYEIFKSRIPEGLTIDHLCKNKICVNPQHMEAVTAVENTMRSSAIPATNARKTHCMRGHPFSGNNLLVYAGKRQCRICLNRAQLIRYYKRMGK